MIYDNANLISGSDLNGDNEIAFHSIVVDNEFMNDIGLGVFTTGQLYQWVTKTNENGDFVNLRFFNNTKLNISSCLDNNVFSKQKFVQQAKSVLDVILGNGQQLLCGSENLIRPGVFSAWRKDDNLLAGEYIKFDDTFITSSDWNIKVSNQSYTYDNLFLSNLQSPTFLDTIISPIIYMNELYVSDPTQFNNGGYGTARGEFLKDIKSSKERYVEWKIKVPFFLHLGVETNDQDQGCIKCEFVTYRLYLYDNNVVRDTSRTITISEPLIVAPKRDTLGRTYLNKEDGKTTPLALTNIPTQNVAAPMSMTWNEFESNWESGTQQILAMITTNIEPATYPSLDKVKNEFTEELLRPVNTFIFPTGKAIPISMQNGNPLQWGPDYLKFENCRDSNNKDKVELTIQNSSLKTWASGDFAILQKINGVWMPSEIARPSASGVTYSTSIGQWELMYLMTNAHFYFRTNDDVGSLPFTYPQYEDSFHKKYYGILNNANDYTKVDNSYFQVTSFDFMGPNIGGLRSNGNALACTQFSIDPAGNPLENNGEYVDGNASAPFFGCVFPDGYNTEGKYDQYQSTNHAKINRRLAQNNVEFFIEINQDKKIFENINVNTGSANAGGIFSSNDASLRHLPADIALNGSPSAINGGPIKDVTHFSYFDNSSSNLKDTIKYYFQSSYGSGNWLYRNNNILDSAFDFKPITPGKIQFRPLKLETYAIFEHQNITTVNQAYNANVYGQFGAQGWKIVDDSKCPIGDFINGVNKVYARNKRAVTSESLFAEDRFSNSNPNNYKGLGYNITGFNTDSYTNLNPLPPDTAKFSPYWWTKSWTLPGPRPAGAVGIIGARCTVVANDKINFTTQNYLGVGSSFNIAGGLSDNTPWEPAWGGYGGDTYNNLQTTQLFARVFQSWPKHLTVYDPRFFAVHHFNDGVELCDNTDSNIDIPATCPTKELYFNGLKSNVTNPPSIKYPDGFYWVDKIESSVDVRIPTYYKTNGSSSTPTAGDMIYSDGPSSAGNLLGLWRKPEHWTIDPKRRGKLLPYENYQMFTIALPTTNLKCWIKNSMPITESILDYSIIVFNAGKNYKIGDTFSISGGSGNGLNYILVAKDVGQDGSIEEFEIQQDSTSYGYATSDFSALSNIVPLGSNITSTAVKIIPKSITDNGIGFEGGFIRGIMSYQAFTDAKPKEACDTQLIKLTPNSPVYPANGSANFIDPVSDEIQVSAQIVNKSSNGKYDVFLHFHNDISHTAMKDWSNGAGGPLAVENHVTLTITPE